MKVLVLDPSGNFIEGKGTTGWALYNEGKLISVGQVRAEETNSQIEFWIDQLNLIDTFKPDILVVESFALYANKRHEQIGSEFETSQIIGVLKYHAYKLGIHYVAQPPSIKPRYTNKILLHKGIISQDKHNRYHAVGLPISGHILDAIRHGEYFEHFTKQKLIKRGVL